jgi:hypothetical protein
MKFYNFSQIKKTQYKLNIYISLQIQSIHKSQFCAEDCAILIKVTQNISLYLYIDSLIQKIIFFIKLQHIAHIMSIANPE